MKKIVLIFAIGLTVLVCWAESRRVGGVMVLVPPTGPTSGDVLTFTNGDWYARAASAGGGGGGSALYVAGNSVTNANFSTYQFAVDASGTNVVIKLAAVATNLINSGAVSISSTDIDWSLGTMYRKPLVANTTFTFSNAKPDSWITVRLTSYGSFTATWPTTTWQSAVTPVQTPSKTDFYNFYYDGTNYLGNVSQNY